MAATSKQNGNFGHVQNSSTEKDVGFVRYIGAIDNDPKRIGFWIGVELFLEPLKGDQSGRIGDQMYFEAPEYSSVFTKVFFWFIFLNGILHISTFVSIICLQFYLFTIYIGESFVLL